MRFMGKTSLWMLLGIGLLAGCGGADEESLTCSKDARRGTYLVHYEPIGGGSCSTPPDALVRPGEFTPDVVCSEDNPAQWSADECRVETSITCTDVQTDYRVSNVGFTDQEDTTGDVLTGIATISVRDANGQPVCSGTFRLTYTRQ
jgi:hypothetical protein